MVGMRTWTCRIAAFLILALVAGSGIHGFHAAMMAQRAGPLPAADQLAMPASGEPSHADESMAAPACHALCSSIIAMLLAPSVSRDFAAAAILSAPAAGIGRTQTPEPHPPRAVILS
jgi:hypothetical protein